MFGRLASGPRCTLCVRLLCEHLDPLKSYASGAAGRVEQWSGARQVGCIEHNGCEFGEEHVRGAHTRRSRDARHHEVQSRHQAERRVELARERRAAKGGSDAFGLLLGPVEDEEVRHAQLAQRVAGSACGAAGPKYKRRQIVGPPALACVEAGRKQVADAYPVSVVREQPPVRRARQSVERANCARRLGQLVDVGHQRLLKRDGN
mmetsp:Transcript_30483/g.98480  ORF Transcript_30483/g.98480 Transcript_30483/m.98480 type:complete len:205 (+) Transcript_30483:258-872(+)|eukprot:scaffold1441_cov120-Isochrysis_galbana.AAC.18